MEETMNKNFNDHLYQFRNTIESVKDTYNLHKFLKPSYRANLIFAKKAVDSR